MEAFEFNKLNGLTSKIIIAFLSRRTSYQGPAFLFPLGPT